MSNVIKMEPFCSYLPNKDSDYCNAAFYVREDSWPTSKGKKTVLKSHAVVKLPLELAGQYADCRWKINSYFHTADGKPSFIIEAVSAKGKGLVKGGPRYNERTLGHVLSWSWPTIDGDESFRFGKSACSAIEISGGLFLLVVSAKAKKARQVKHRTRSSNEGRREDSLRMMLLKAAIEFFGGPNGR